MTTFPRPPYSRDLAPLKLWFFCKMTPRTPRGLEFIQPSTARGPPGVWGPHAALQALSSWGGGSGPQGLQDSQEELAEQHCGPHRARAALWQRHLPAHSAKP